MRAPSFDAGSGTPLRAIQHACIGVAVALLVGGCSKSPLPPSEVVTLAITPQPDVLLVGGSVALTATNVVTGAVVQPTWSSSDPTVAVVTTGQLRALRAGVATISAVYKGSNAIFVIKVVPDYGGTYDGTMFVVQCTDTSPATFCPICLST